MAKENEIITKIFLNDSQAKEKLDELKAKMEEIRKKRDDAFKVDPKADLKKYNDQLRLTQKQISNILSSGDKINYTLEHLSTASVNELRRDIAVINNELKSGRVLRGSEDWKVLNAQLKKCKEELYKINQESKAATDDKSLFSKVAGFLNKNWGAITQIFAGFSTTTQMVRNTIAAFAEMQQEMQNVRKYTGQTTEEVEHMNEVFKQMDTRTSREELNQLAGSAGRLGITAEKDILEFVDAADKINVALGDDLGKGAVDSIGKLAMAFGEDDRMGLRGAMLATGSAVNELAQKSSTQAGYLVDFTARLAGVGVQAGLSQAQIMGWGSVLDENMQKEEMAATALSQIISTMATDSSKMAKVAGLDAKAFADLIKNDMNGALMQFFDAMKAKGGFTSLAPMFADMGLDGARATSVLAVLANKIDDVRKNQETANGAYKQGTSVLEEFDVQNKTVQAGLDKAKKKFRDLCVELGERLEPIGRYTISTMSIGIRVLNELVKFTSAHWRVLTVLTTGIVAYTAAVKVAAVWDKVTVGLHALKSAALKAEAVLIDIITGKVGLATLAQKLWNKVIIANPFVAFAATVMTAVGAVLAFTNAADDATEAQKRLKEAQDEAMSTTNGERAELEALVATAQNKSLADDTRREAIRQLQEKYPGYLQNLKLEEINSQNARTAIDNLTKSLVEEAKARILVKKIQEAEEEKEKLDDKYFSGISGFWQNLVATFGAGLNDIADKSERIFNVFKYGDFGAWDMKTYIEEGGYAINNVTYLWNNYKAAVADVDNTIKGLNNELKKSVQTSSKLASSNPLNKPTDQTDYNSSSSQTPYISEKQLKEQKQEELAALRLVREKKRIANDAAKAITEQELAELTHRYAMGKILYCDYIDEQERIQLDDLDRRMLIYEKDSLEFQKLNRKKEELLLNGSEESRKLSLANMKHEHEQRLAALEELAWRENMTEQQKNEMIFREDMRFMDEQRILYRKGTLERIDLENDIEAEQQQHRLQTEQYYQQQLDQVREQYLNQSDEKMKDLAMQHIDELHERKLLSEEEFHEALLALDAQYANYESNSEHDQRVGANAYKVAQNSAKQDVDASGSKSANLPIMGDIMLYKSTMEQLKQMYKSDEITHAEYLAAKSQATAQFCEGLAQKFQAAYQSVNQIMSAASGYFSAQQEYETTMVQKKYEKQIAAAGNNQARVKKLQEKQQKEEAAIKTKYARKQAAIQVAQAIAGTAMSAIQAYASAAAVPVVGYILAPIAAAAALAAGMLQVATIKKQQKAQEAGYYEGGFTGGRQYRREAGVVHEGEFVANHRAVQNPAVLPVLNFLDQAQRNNTIGSLTARDVSRSVGMPATTQVVAPVVNVQTDNAELRDAIQAQQAATAALLDRLSEPIEAQMVMHDFDRDYKRYQNLMKNK